MTFDAREVVASFDESEHPPFPFIGLDGKEHLLPSLMTLTERQIAAVRNGDEEMLLEMLGEGTYEALQDLPLHVSEALSEAWFKGVGEAGKSPSPSRATRRAAKRSPQT